MDGSAGAEAGLSALPEEPHASRRPPWRIPNMWERSDRPGETLARWHTCRLVAGAARRVEVDGALESVLAAPFLRNSVRIALFTRGLRPGLFHSAPSGLGSGAANCFASLRWKTLRALRCPGRPSTCANVLGLYDGLGAIIFCSMTTKARRTSFTIESKSAVNTIFLGLMTTSAGISVPGRVRRTASRRRRFMRLRWTAPPRARPTVNPTRRPAQVPVESCRCQ